MVQTKHKKLKEVLVSLLILLPYLEGSAVNSDLTIRVGEISYLRPINIYMAVVIVLLIIQKLLFSNRENRRLTVRAGAFLLLLLVTALSSFLRPVVIETSVCTWIWFAEPILYALLLADYIKDAQLGYHRILKNICVIFGLFCAYRLLGYVLVVGFDSGSRLRSTGGGPVIFGYTIVIMSSALLFERKLFKKRWFYFFLIVNTLTAFATGSRGAIWPILFLWVLYFLLDDWSATKFLLSILLAIFFISLAIIDLSGIIASSTENISRILDFEDASRLVTDINSLRYFSRQSLVDMIFGKGLGNFYPNQYWSLLVQDKTYNTFIADGLIMLVQPHNSFIYMLVENGLVGLAFMVVYLTGVLRKIRRSRMDNYVFAIVTVLVIIFVNCFDSIFMVQPGVAGNIWLLLFLLDDMATEAKPVKVTKTSADLALEKEYERIFGTASERVLEPEPDEAGAVQDAGESAQSKYAGRHMAQSTSRP